MSKEEEQVATTTASTTATDDGNGGDDDDAPVTDGTLLKQTLLSIEEVFVYKIPPLRAHGGHRAEDWDLANPLQTCGFQVERRNNDLYLIFTTQQHTKIFALAKYIPHTNSVEPVVDSSRYFVTQLVQNDTTTPTAGTAAPNSPPSSPKQQSKRTVWIGFGFRNRDSAVDLLGVLQQFSKSIDREIEAKKKVDLAQQHLSQTRLHDGDKIHIVFGSKEKSKIVHDNDSSSKKEKKKNGNNNNTVGGTGGNGGGVLLLKKPPGYHQQQETKISIDTHNVPLLSKTPPSSSTGGLPSSKDSAAAVATSITSNDELLGDLTDDDDIADGIDDGDLEKDKEKLVDETGETNGGGGDTDDEWNDFQGA